MPSISTTASHKAVASSVVCLLLLLGPIGITYGFHYHHRHLVASHKTSVTLRRIGKDATTISASSKASPSPSSVCNKLSKRRIRMSPGDKRRAVLAKLVATASTSTAALYCRGQRRLQPPNEALSFGIFDPSSSSSSLLPTMASNKERLMSVDEAVAVLEASCDRRFLHAVVATDYRLMFRGISEGDSERPTVVVGEPSDLLFPSTYGSEEAAGYFRGLENGRLAGKPVRPSNGHIATTSVSDAKKWGGHAASIWPLDADVHYAWLERGGNFWPTKDGLTARSTSSVIIDGVDCGRDSLDYALERDNSEIMFKADRYLAVPVSMEDQLLSRLRNAFLI